MLRFESFDGSLDDWGKVLDTLPGRELFQAPAWLRFLAESQRATPVVAVLKDHDRVLGYFAGLTLRKLGVKILGSPFVGWTTEHMGLRLMERTPKQEAVRALERYAFGQLGCAHLEFCDLDFAPEDMAGLGYTHTTHHGTIVDLRPDEEAIYHGLSSKSCRYSIRKAAKLGVVVEEARDDAFAEDYYAQLVEVFGGQSLTPTYGIERVRLLIRHLLPTGNLLLLRARDGEGRCIATGIFPAMFDTAYFWGNASWKQHRHLSPNEPLHWHAMRYWKRRQVQWYDLCGGGDYKQKYGGHEHKTYFFRKSKYVWVRAARSLAFHVFKMRQRLQGWNRHRRLGNPAPRQSRPEEAHDG
jgi:hypothetical protein